MRMGGQRYAPAAVPPGKTWYLFYRRLGEPQGRSGRVRKISPPTRIRSPDRPARSDMPTELFRPLSLKDTRNKKFYLGGEMRLSQRSVWRLLSSASGAMGSVRVLPADAAGPFETLVNPYGTVPCLWIRTAATWFGCVESIERVVTRMLTNRPRIIFK